MTKIGFSFERRSNDQEAWGLLISLDYRNHKDGLSRLDQQMRREPADDEHRRPAPAG